MHAVMHSHHAVFSSCTQSYCCLHCVQVHFSDLQGEASHLPLGMFPSSWGGLRELLGKRCGISLRVFFYWHGCMLSELMLWEDRYGHMVLAFGSQSESASHLYWRERGKHDRQRKTIQDFVSQQARQLSSHVQHCAMLFTSACDRQSFRWSSRVFVGKVWSQIACLCLMAWLHVVVGFMGKVVWPHGSFSQSESASRLHWSPKLWLGVVAIVIVVVWPT